MKTTLRLTRDPAIDRSVLAHAWIAIRRWSPGLAFVLVLAVMQGLVEKWDAEDTAEIERHSALQAREALAAKIAAHRIALAGGTCDAMFYLVEADDLPGARQKLYRASTALDGLRGLLFRESVPLPAKESR